MKRKFNAISIKFSFNYHHKKIPFADFLIVYFTDCYTAFEEKMPTMLPPRKSNPRRTKSLVFDKCLLLSFNIIFKYAKNLNKFKICIEKCKFYFKYTKNQIKI